MPAGAIHATSIHSLFICINGLRTSNHVERANRYYRKRAKSHYRNRTKRAIWNMVKTDLMVRKANHGYRPPQKLQPRIEETEIFAA
ncbi:MAG: hypothetical protein O7A06_01155 [Acidobacteria bacterium]|nr:hypothetical protein [Acidobacteriota bacterium]